MIAHDGDSDERAAVEGLDEQLRMIRRRQAADPPIELLSGAEPGSQPEEPFDRITEQRLWRAIQSRLPEARPARSIAWTRWTAGVAAIAATIVMAVVVNRDQDRAAVPPSPVPAPAQPAPGIVALDFTKPEVKLSPAALTWRGAGAESPFVRDLKPAVDAYRSGEYAAAESHFAELAERYPGGRRSLLLPRRRPDAAKRFRGRGGAAGRGGGTERTDLRRGRRLVSGGRRAAQRSRR